MKVREEDVLAIKAVFFDIDGTLLNDRKNVSKSTQEAIKAMKDQGILVGLATGRGPSFVNPFMENLGLDFAVTYNGQYTITRDKVLYESRLSKNVVKKLIKYATDRRREVSLGLASGLIGSNIINMGTSRFGQIVSSIVPKTWAKGVERSFKHLVRRFFPQNVDNLRTIMKNPVYQVVLVATEQESDTLRKKFPDLTVTRSSPYSADIIAKGQSKIKGIERVGKSFGFELDEVMAFGDSENDIEMLSGVGVGVAMGNASDEVKELAHYTTDTNNHHGIAHALAHFGLIHFKESDNFVSKDENFNRVRDFHLMVDGEINDRPRVFTLKDANHRADFKIEELVEFLYVASNGDRTGFREAVAALHVALDKAVDKVETKPLPDNPLIGETDALLDLLYLTYGSFALMGVDPQPIFEIVHEANMGKLFPDGQAHFDPVTHKVLKPEDWEEKFAPEPAIKRELNRQIQRSIMRSTEEQHKKD